MLDDGAWWRATNTATALALVAQRYEQPAAALQHMSRRALEHELAGVLYRWTQERARQLLADGAAPPAGDDLLERIIRRTYHRRKAEAEAVLNAEANRRFAEVLAKRSLPAPDS